MDLSQVLSIAFACIISAGGVGGIAIAVIKFSSNIIAERISAKYENKLEQALEKLKTDLSKKEYVSKVRFDAEFDIYRNLSKEFSQMIKYINIMIPEGLSYVPADDAKRKEQENKVYTEAHNHTNASQETLYANIAFIPEIIYKDYNEIITLCQNQLFAYERRFNSSYLATQKEKETFTDQDYERKHEINNKWRNINNEVRKHLSKLDIVD